MEKKIGLDYKRWLSSYLSFVGIVWFWKWLDWDCVSKNNDLLR